jgi:NADH:ubiquinone oxidoreductase subunit 3 (subunit A)
MENQNFWITAPVLFTTFMILASLLMSICNLFAAKSQDNPDKYLHYSCGEDMEVHNPELNYHAYFRLALLFGILHIAALIISTIPPGNPKTKTLSGVYLIGVSVSIFILLERNDDK